MPTSQSTRTIKNTDEKSYAVGYNSDGEVGPFFDAVVGEMEVYNSEDSSCNDYDEIPPPKDIGSPASGELDPSEGRSIMMRFLRPKIIDDYNTQMNGVDIADQLRNQYWVDQWMRKRKWWWGIQVLLVNSYLLYKTVHLIVWKKNPKTLLSHYEFRYAIVMAWFGVTQNMEEGSTSSSTKCCWDDISSITPNSAASFTKRAKHVNNNSLDPVTGSLHDHLGLFPMMESADSVDGPIPQSKRSN